MRARRALPAGFRIFLAGRAVSALGGTFSLFALPLLVFRLTGSPLDLGVATAVSFSPYLLFGFVLGALADRWDRRRVIVTTDLLRAVVIALPPLLDQLGSLRLGWLYAVMVLSTTLKILGNASVLASLPNLVPADAMTTANVRWSTMTSLSDILGPIAAGALVAVVPPTDLFLADAASFLLAAASVTLIRADLNPPEVTAKPAPSELGVVRELRREVRSGLSYLWSHPVLRNLTITITVVNLFAPTVRAQLFVYARDRLAVSDGHVSVLLAGGAVGTVLLVPLAGILRARVRFVHAALGTLALSAVLTSSLAWVTDYPLAVVVWAAITGLTGLYISMTNSLRMEVVPNQLLGRVTSASMTLAWSVVPVGTVLGGAAVSRTGSVVPVYAGIGVGMLVVAAVSALAWRDSGDREQAAVPVPGG